MSSNSSDVNEIIRLLLQQQQHSQPQQVQGVTTLQQQIQNQGPPSYANINMGESDALGNLVVGYLKALTGNSTTAAPAPSNDPGLSTNNSLESLLSLNSPNNNVACQQQQQQPQQLLESLRLLAATNPNLAANVAAPRQQQQLPPSSNQQEHLLAALISKTGNNTLTISQPMGTSISAANNRRTSMELNGSTSQIPPQNKGNRMGNTGQGHGRPPPEPVSLSTLQEWNLMQLEEYVKQLEEHKLQVPNAINILLSNAKQKEEKRQAKLMANRKASSCSRARKIKLVEELKEANAKLEYQASVLRNIPDAILALDTDGNIQFVSAQLARMLQTDSDKLVGSSIYDILASESKVAVRRLIQDLVTAEMLEAEGGTREERVGKCYDYESGGSSENIYSRELSNDDNVISRSSDQASPHGSEFNADSQGNAGKGNDVQDSSDNLASENTSRPYKLISAQKKFSPQESDISNDQGSSSFIGMSYDNVMGAPVTANNSSAKLSSLMYYLEEGIKEGDSDRKLTKTELEAHQQEEAGRGPCTISALASKQSTHQSSSSTNSEEGSGTGATSSEDSRNRSSNRSSGGYSGDDSSMSGKGCRTLPLAPSCIIRLINGKDSTIACELTSSIRTRTLNDEDVELGLVDLNPPKTKVIRNKQTEEKELLLCLRPIIVEGDKVDNYSRHSRQMYKTNGAKESEESERHKVSSGSDGTELTDSSEHRARDKKLKWFPHSKKHAVEHVDNGIASSTGELRRCAYQIDCEE